MAGRLIFHCDGNNFFASCECIEHPEWRDVPMAVAGDPKDRCGIVVAKNELAKKAGVKTTDTIWQARQKCPNILFVPPHHDEYARVSRRMNAIFREYTDFVEPASIDESYLDMTGAPGFYGLSPRELADLLRRRVREEIGITISVGVSFCKVFAKMGSDYTDFPRELSRNALPAARRDDALCRSRVRADDGTPRYPHHRRTGGASPRRLKEDAWQVWRAALAVRERLG